MLRPIQTDTELGKKLTCGYVTGHEAATRFGGKGRMQCRVAQASLDVLSRAYPTIPEKAVEQIKKPNLLSDTSETCM